MAASEQPVQPDELERRFQTTQEGAEEKRKLKKQFGSGGLFVFLICTLVGLDTIGSVAKSGAQGFTWLIFLAAVFFVPYGLLIAELGSTFTEEGGPYIWTRMAFGRFTAAIAIVMYWLSNPIWIGGTLTITAIASITTFFGPLSNLPKYLIALAFIWLTIASAIASIRHGAIVAAAGAWARVLVLGLFTVTVLLYAARHGLHGFGPKDFLPSYATFIAVVPALVFNYVGFELPSGAGDEMRNAQRDIPRAIARSAIGSVLLYGLPIFCVLIVLPSSRITGLGGFLDAIKAVFVVYGGSVASDGSTTLTSLGLLLGRLAALGFLIATASSGAVWLMGADRALAVACYDGAGPRVLGRFSTRFGTPVIANVASGILSTLVMVLAFQLAQGDANRYFSAVLGLAISTTTISYLFIFPSVIVLRRTRADVVRPYRIPWGNTGVWLCGILASFWALVATIGLIWPGVGVNWFGAKGVPDSALPTGFEHLRLQYELIQVVPLVVIFMVGALFYALGSSTRAQLAAPNSSDSATSVEAS